MAAQFGRVGRVYMVRWSDPVPADVARIVGDLPRAHEEVGAPLIYVAIIPEDCRPPPAPVRRALDAALAVVHQHCELAYFVVEGTGFRHSILRTILAANILATGKRGQVRVDSSLESLTINAAPSHRQDLARAFALARTNGILKAA